MKLATAAMLLATAAAIPGITVHDAAAQNLLEGILGGSDGDAGEATGGLAIQASFYPYYEFTKAVASENDTVGMFLPPGVLLHDWEPSLPRMQSLQNSDVFVYNGLGVEGYIERLADLEDLSLIFIKASEGLVLITTASVADVLMEILAEYEEGHVSGEEAAGSIEEALNREETRGILAEYEEGHVTTEEAVQHIYDVYGGAYEYTVLPDARAVLYNMSTGDTSYEDGLEIIHRMAEEYEEAGHDDHDDGHDDNGDDHGHGDDHNDGHDDGHDDHGDGHHDHGLVDPHVWLDPVLAIQQVFTIRDGLAKANPAGAETYGINAEAYAEELEELHHDYSHALADCRQDTIVTNHLAFGYMVERYGINIKTLGGFSPEGASVADIAALADYMIQNEIKYVLAEDIVDTRAMEVLAEETGAEVLTLSPLESVTREQLDDGVTYIDRMRDNLQILEVALSCN